MRSAMGENVRAGADQRREEACVPEQGRQAGPLDRAQSGDWLAGLEELEAEAKPEVADHEQLEQITFAMRPAAEPKEQRQQAQQKKGDLIQLGWMARNAVAEVDGPGQLGGQAVGVIVQPGQEAAEAPDRNPDGQRE